MSKYAKDVNKLLKAIKKGDTSKFDKLFDLTANHLLGVARYYLENKSYFEDVVTDVFEKVFIYIYAYDENQDGYNWMCKITENVAHDYNRKLPQELPLFEVSEQDIKQELRIDELYLDVSLAVDKLDRESREMVFKRFYFDQSYEEIGKDFNLTKSAVKKRIDKILIKLKKLLKTGNFE